MGRRAKPSQILDMSEDYASMDKPQLTSMIHFLEERDEESKKLDEQLKEEKKTHQTSDFGHQTSI